MSILLPLVGLQFLIYIDRGVLPGCSADIDGFIQKSLHTEHPNLYLGTLQSAFIIGLSIACPIVAHLSVKHNSYYLIASGVFVWFIGELLTFISSITMRYSILLIARILTGAGEAALLSIVPPLILATAGKSAGLWMGALFSVIPIGTAAGFVYGSYLTHIWPLAYLGLGFLGLPFIIYCISQGDCCSVHPLESSLNDNDENDSEHIITLRNLLRTLYNNKRYRWICIAYAAYAAAVTSFSTFGPAFMIDTGVVRLQETAGVLIGIVVAIAGILGGILGGWLISKAEDTRDKIDTRQLLSDTVTTISDNILENRIIRFRQYTISLSILGTCLLLITPWISINLLFLMSLCISLISLFALQAILNVCCMIVVPTIYRPAALAVMTWFLHFAGDVPGPMIIGYIKDTLAPGCISQPISPECISEAWKVKITESLCGMWLGWSVLGVWIATK